MNVTTKDNSKYVPEVNFPELMQAEIHSVEKWLNDVSLFVQKVATPVKNSDDEEAISEITEMVLADDYKKATQSHIELIGFYYQVRYLSNVKPDLDMDVLELYLSYIQDRLKGLTPHIKA